MLQFKKNPKPAILSHRHFFQCCKTTLCPRSKSGYYSRRAAIFVEVNVEKITILQVWREGGGEKKHVMRCLMYLRSLWMSKPNRRCPFKGIAKIKQVIYTQFWSILLVPWRMSRQKLNLRTNHKQAHLALYCCETLRCEQTIWSYADMAQTIVLVARRPTPRANCSSRPEMAPEGLGAEDFRPTVEL